jgi:hypothetical protein
MSDPTCRTCSITPVLVAGRQCPACQTAESIAQQTRILKQSANDAQRKQAQTDRDELYRETNRRNREIDPDWEPSLGPEAPMQFADGRYNWAGIIYGIIVLSIVFIFYRGIYRYWIGL